MNYSNLDKKDERPCGGFLRKGTREFVVIIDGLKIYKLPLTRPPQLLEALGYFGKCERIGVWQDNYKTTVSDGYSTFTASNPGWDSYYSHSQINYYMRYLHSKGINLYGEIENFGVAKYGFVISEDSIYLAEVKTITELLQKNRDYRPNWVKDATEVQAFDPIWMAKYQEWNESIVNLFPKYNSKCYQATKEMLEWLENRN